MPEEKSVDAAAVEGVQADAAEATPGVVSSDTRLRFVLTVEGDGTTGHIKVEAWKYDADGKLVEAAPVKEREAENVVIALYDGGIFFQTTSLLMGRTMALASGDLLRAMHIDATAARLGISLPQIADDEPTEEERAAVQQMFKDTISKALAG